MKVALLQYPIVWGDKDTNVRLTAERIRAVRGQTDVVLLPEMFSTGFVTDDPSLAEPVDGSTMQTLQGLSDECELAICGTFICSSQGRLYNRGFFVQPHKSPDFIDKRHLYASGGENVFFVPGHDRTIFEYKGVKFLLIICYDLRFPVWARNMSGTDYDVILVSANWPTVRIGYWDTLIPARAIENQCLICGVNIVGEDGLGQTYNGHSVAYNTRMNKIVEFGNGESGTQIADLNIERLHHFREALPLWKDTDQFTIHL